MKTDRLESLQIGHSHTKDVFKALNGAPDISETLQKTVLETAVEMGYTKIRRQKAAEKKLCILIENVDYKESHQFGYEILLGFRQLAEPAGYTVDIVDTTEKLQKSTPYDVFMLQNQYLGAFVVGFSLNDPWMKDFQTSRTPTVLYDNYIIANPNMAYVGIDNNEGMELAVSHLKKLGHKKIGYLSSALGSHIMQIRHKAVVSNKQIWLPPPSASAPDRRIVKKSNTTNTATGSKTPAEKESSFFASFLSV